MGIGLNGQKGVFWDYDTDRYGIYSAYGISIGLDASIGGTAGVIYGDDSFKKFKGESYSSNVGILLFTFTVIYDNENNWIGNAIGVDGGPLPASMTLDFSRTYIKSYITGAEIKQKIQDKLWQIYDKYLSDLF